MACNNMSLGKKDQTCATERPRKKTHQGGTLKRMSFRMSRTKSIGDKVDKRFTDLLHKDVPQSWSTKGKAEDFQLERSWREIVDEKYLSQCVEPQQDAIWELIRTEVNFIVEIETIILVFQARFKLLQYEGFLSEINDELIFGNIHQVYNANLALLRRLKTMLVKTRESAQPFCPSDLCEVFQGIDTLFHPYIEYCNSNVSALNLPPCSPITDEMMRQYFAWCQDFNSCINTLTLNAYLLKPVQRITKYAILLDAIVNTGNDKNTAQEIQLLVKEIEMFVNMISPLMASRQEKERANIMLVSFPSSSNFEVSDEVTNQRNCVQTSPVLDKPPQNATTSAPTSPRGVTKSDVETHKDYTKNKMLRKAEKQRCLTLILPNSNSSVKESEKSFKVYTRDGKTLADVVRPVLRAHGLLPTAAYSLYLESSPLPENEPLPLNGNSCHFEGSILHIRKTKDLRRVQKSSSFKQRFHSHGEIDKTNTDFTALLEKKITRSEKKNSVSLWNEEFRLESCWRSIIDDEKLTQSENLRQESIWELVKTEVDYIKDIETIILVFQARFKILQYGGFLSEVDDNLLFANIHQVYCANVKFWNNLKKIVDKTRYDRQPISPFDIAGAFEEVSSLFHPYIEFCNADISIHNVLKYSPATNDMLKQYFAWCQKQDACRKLTLGSFFIKPLQRITKYALLLKAIFNNTDSEADKFSLELLMAEMETFVSKINASMASRQENEKYNYLVSQFSSDYSPIKAVNEEEDGILKKINKLSITGKIPGLPDREGRRLVREGSFNLLKKHGHKLVHVFLFSDAFLVTKLSKPDEKYHIQIPPFRLDRLVVHDMKNPGQFFIGHLNEFDAPDSTIVLQTDIEEKKKWLMSFKQEKERFEEVKTGGNGASENLPIENHHSF